MNIKNFVLVALLLSSIALFSCKNKKKDAVENVEKTEDVQQEQAKADETLSIRVKNFLNNIYLNEGDKRAMTADQKKYQMYQIDLNNDGKEETFVLFKSSYFCGSGGCTMLLLDDKLSLITEFTVTNPPIYVSKTTKNDWKVLYVKSEGEWKELIYENDTYPSNPTVAPKSSVKSPEKDADVIFEESQNLKTYNF